MTNRLYEAGEHVQHRDGTWCFIVGYDDDGLVILLEEEPSGNETMDGYFKTPESSIARRGDPMKRKHFVEVKSSGYTLADL